MLKNSSTLAVSVPINVSIKLDLVSVNGSRETYFVDALLLVDWTMTIPFFFFFIHCYLETLQHLGHIVSRIFGCIPEGCVFLLLCSQCFNC